MNSINYNGFVLYKKNVTKEVLKKIKKELTIVPHSNFGNIEPQPFRVFSELEDYIILPIYYAIKLENIKYNVNFETDNFKYSNFESCNIILRDSMQLECYQKCISEKEKEFGGGILNLATASGKTVLFLKIASHFALKTLIIVKNIDLIDQWKNEIRKFIPKARIGLIQGKIFDINDKDIVIGMLKTISMKKELSSENFKWVGVCVYDEVHNISTDVFSKIMIKINPRYIFGLTATLERKDKTENVIKYYIGDIIHSNISNAKKQNTEIHIYKYTGKSSVPKTLRDGTAAVSSMISAIADDTYRSDMIVNILNELLKDPLRMIVVISDRITQLKYIHLKLGKEVSGLYIGSTKQVDKELAKTKQILLATYPLISEGFNHPKLNCIVFATPRASLVQAIGRIYRKNHENIEPIIVDIVDSFSIFTGQHYRRKKIYKEAIENCIFKTTILNTLTNENTKNSNLSLNLQDEECFSEHSDEKEQNILGDFNFLGDSDNESS